MKEIAAAFSTLSQEQIGQIERTEGVYTLSLASGDVNLSKGDYEIISEDMPGWLVATEGQLTVALDIVQTPELIREGNARELIHPIQNLRKESGFDVTDRIETVIYADGDNYNTIGDALEHFGDYVASQTLSVSLTLERASLAPDCAHSIEWDKGTILIYLKRK